MLKEMLQFYADAKSKALKASHELIVEGDKAVIFLEKFFEKFADKPLYLSDLSEKQFLHLYTAIDNLRKLINAVANVDEQIKNEHNAIVTGQYMPVINTYFSKQQTLAILPKELQEKIIKKEKNHAELLQELDSKRPQLQKIETQALHERTYSDFMSDISVKLQAAERLLDSELTEGISLTRLAEREKYDPKLTAGLDWEKFADHYNLLMPDELVNLDTLIALNPDKMVKIQLQLPANLKEMLQAMNHSLNLSIADVITINQAHDQLKKSKISTDEFIKLFKEKTQLEKLPEKFIANLPVAIVSKKLNDSSEPLATLVTDNKVTPQVIATSKVKPEVLAEKSEVTTTTPTASHPEANSAEVASQLDNGLLPPELLAMQQRLTTIDVQQRIIASQKNVNLRLSQKTIQKMDQDKTFISLDEFVEICKNLKQHAAFLQNSPSVLTNMNVLIKSTANYFFEKIAAQIKNIKLDPRNQLNKENISVCVKAYEKLIEIAKTLPSGMNFQDEIHALIKLNADIKALVSQEKMQQTTNFQLASTTFKDNAPQQIVTVQVSNTALTYTATQDGLFNKYQRSDNYSLNSAEDVKRGYTDDEKIVLKDMVGNAVKSGETQFTLQGNKALCKEAARNLLAVLPTANIFINGSAKAYQPDLKERIEINRERNELKAAAQIEKTTILPSIAPTFGSAA